jgi:hypothetical protein
MTCLKKELEVQLSSSSSSPPTTSKSSDLRIDINPSSWLTPYRRTSLGYLTKMLLFYHGVGILIMIIGTTIIQNLVPEYQDVSVIPSLFFSLRTWISGKGWFAVLTHSLWNGIFFTLGCLVGEVSCSLTLRGSDIWTSSSSLWLSAILIVLVFILYKRKPSRTL